jgi:hypothetical protein
LSAVRIGAAVVLVAAAAILACVAADVLSWRGAIQNGDREFVRSPADARWSADTVLPPGSARWLLDLGVPLRFRGAEQRFAALSAEGRGYDNGVSATRSRGELEAVLAELGRAEDGAIASQAENLLGILAYSDSRQTGPIAAAPVDQSVAAFQAAVRLDPTNTDAKFNLELLLRQLVAKGAREGPSSDNDGQSKGRRGAGGGLPGRGY